MHVHWLQHAPFEGLGCIEPWLRERGAAFESTRLWAGDLPPSDSSSFDWLIVMGGPMNVHEHERHPWLAPEKALIRDAIAAGKRVLGICLGAQLIADALGAPVIRNREPEIGWFPVRLTSAGRACSLFADFPERFEAFHWHSDTFTIPSGAVCLAESDACANQALVHGDRVVGVQFHLEMTPDGARALCMHTPVTPSRYVQSAEEMLRETQRFERANRLMHMLLERLASMTT